MNINCDTVRLEFYDLGETQKGFALIYFHPVGWNVERDRILVKASVPWKEAFDSLTTAERVRCIVFANQMR